MQEIHPDECRATLVKAKIPAEDAPPRHDYPKAKWRGRSVGHGMNLHTLTTANVRRVRLDYVSTVPPGRGKPKGRMVLSSAILISPPNSRLTFALWCVRVHSPGFQRNRINVLALEGNHVSYVIRRKNTNHARWPKSGLLNRCTGKTVPGVRIPLSPPF
jgi:hypothetical protein